MRLYTIAGQRVAVIPMSLGCWVIAGGRSRVTALPIEAAAAGLCSASRGARVRRVYGPWDEN